jgi:hypothetical protein
MSRYVNKYVQVEYSVFNPVSYLYGEISSSPEDKGPGRGTEEEPKLEGMKENK